MASTTIDVFVQIESDIATNNIATAQTLYDALDPDDLNTVELNYKNFYTIYINYLNNSDTLTSDDSTALLTLSNLCPATDGACVYSARSFYGSVYGTVINYPDCAGEEGSRLAYNESKNSSENKKKLSWNLKIYPNPTSSRLTLKSSNETELLYLEVKDLSNRILLKKVVKTSAFIYTLDLDLINGAYFITIGNDKNEKVIKKLLIAK